MSIRMEILKKLPDGAGEVALTDLLEDPGLIPSLHVAAHNNL